MADKNQILEDRDTGLRYADIARKHGVSRQYVSAICGRYNPSRFRFITETGCAYPNLRQWMNENKVSLFELLRRMGFEVHSANSERLRSYMTGRAEPRKPYIDKLIAVTGMPYEMLFDDKLWEGDMAN
jgi:transcriptional regulator with XRE-family HTH domain